MLLSAFRPSSMICLGMSLWSGFVTAIGDAGCGFLRRDVDGARPRSTMGMDVRRRIDGETRGASAPAGSGLCVSRMIGATRR